MAREFTFEVHMIQVDCTCGVTFAIPKRLNDSRRDNGTTFSCPNGHKLSYSETEVAKLQKELKVVRAERDKRIQERNEATRALRAAEEKLERYLNPPKITPGTLKEKVMTYLKGQEPLTVTEIASGMDKRRPSVSSTCTILWQEGFLQRTGEPPKYEVVVR